jgi:hypothetical protein
MPRRRRPLEFEVLGIEDISAYFKELGKVPQKTVRKAAKKGATIVRNKVRSDIQLPVKYGWLRDGITIVEENVKRDSTGKSIGRNRTGKAGFEVTFDRAFNGIFQKDIKEKGIYGGKKETGYYPASMEYGFKTKKGQIGGHHFLEIVGRREESGIQDKMLEIISKEIDKLEKKKASNSNS